MSKFIEKLEKVEQATPTPLGFGSAARKEQAPPQIMIIGQASADDASSLEGVGSSVDAVLISLGSAGRGALDTVATVLKGVIWGVRVGEINTEQASQLKEIGCDFIVFDPDDTSAAVLNDDELGKVIAITSELDEDTARAIHELPVDAAMFSHDIELNPLTVRKVIDIQTVRGMIGKPFVMACPVELDVQDLETFRNADIAGLVVSVSARDTIKNMRESIKTIPKRKPRARSGEMVPVVSTGFRPAAHEHADEPDEDDDDF